MSFPLSHYIIPISHQNSSESIEINPQNDCPICLTTTPSDQIVRIPHCNHSFCSPCFQQYLKEEISSLYKIMKIKCPHEHCTETIHSSLIQQTLDPADFQQYKKLIAMKSSLSQAKFCPQSGCSKPLNISPDTSYTLCSCGIQICNQCCNPFHEGKTCLESLDVEFEAYKEENNVRFCFMCKTIVTKVEGCVHITCPICDYEWCWLCGQEHTTVHASECLRIWDPIPPRIIAEQAEKELQLQSPPKTLTKRIMLIFLEQLFWPVFLMDIVGILKTKSTRVEEKFEKSVLALFMNIIYLLTFIFIKNMIEMFPEDLEIFMWALVAAIAFPWVVKGIEYYNRLKNNNQRWMSRNFNKFNYTTTSRPGSQDRAAIDIHNLDADENDEEDLDAYIF